MPDPSAFAVFAQRLRRCGVRPEDEIDRLLERMKRAGDLPEHPRQLAERLIRDGVLTPFQATQLLKAKHPGLVIDRKYVVLDRLGSGGAGAVWLCEHRTLRKRMAVKVLWASQGQNEETRRRFQREAKLAGRLNHRNIVHAHDFGEVGGHAYLVMDYIEGTTLEQMIRKHGPLPIVQAANFVAQAALGLQHAFEQGIVHRDIKPANLMRD